MENVELLKGLKISCNYSRLSGDSYNREMSIGRYGSKKDAFLRDTSAGITVTLRRLGCIHGVDDEQGKETGECAIRKPSDPNCFRVCRFIQEEQREAIKKILDQIMTTEFSDILVKN